MKKIGLIGGMSWESTITYYEKINRIIKEKLGGFHSAECMLYSLDYHVIMKHLNNGDWNKISNILIRAAKVLHESGVELIVICSNSMYKIFDTIQKAVGVPILHIATATAFEVHKQNKKNLILLGENCTINKNFYENELEKKGISLIIPDKKESDIVNNIICSELCHGIIRIKSKKIVLNIINELKNRGADGIIIGCSEICLIVKSSELSIPLYDTISIHAKYSVLYALGEGSI
jgi:aspartate racemase